MSNKKVKKIISMVIALIMVIGVGQSFFVYASETDTPTQELGESALMAANALMATSGTGINVTIENINGGAINATSLDAADNKTKIFPVGTTTNVAKPAEGLKVRVIIDHYWIMKNDEHARGSNVTATYADGTVVTPVSINKNSKTGEFYAAEYLFTQDVTITGKLDFFEPYKGGGFTAIEADKSHYIFPENGSATVNTQVRAFNAEAAEQGEELAVQKFVLGAKTQYNANDLFSITESGMLTSNAPITTLGGKGISLTYTLTDGKTIEDSVYLEFGGFVETYGYLTDGYRMYLDKERDPSEWFSATRYFYEDDSLSQIIATVKPIVPDFHGATLDGWYDLDGNRFDDNGTPLAGESYMTLLARYRLADGTLHSAPAYDMDGNVFDSYAHDDNGTDGGNNGTGGNTNNGSGSGNGTISNGSSSGSGRSGRSSNGRNSTTGSGRVDNNINLVAALTNTTVATTSNVTTTTTVAVNNLETKTAVAEVGKAITAAGASKDVTVKIQNVSTISLDTLKAMTAKAEGKNLNVYAYTSSPKGGVNTRISFNPASMTAGINVSASTESTRAAQLNSLFSKHYANKVTVLAVDQATDFAVAVEYAVKVDPSIDVKNIVFYTYTAETGKYAKFTPTEVWVDANGYLHFTTAKAGNTVISVGALTKK